jgi:hypothetical protein
MASMKVHDELEPFSVDHELFTLTKPDLCAQLVEEATSVKALVGHRDNTHYRRIGRLRFDPITLANPRRAFHHQP